MMIVFVLGVIIFFLNLTNNRTCSDYFKTIKKNSIVFFLSISLLLSTLIASNKTGLTTINDVISVIFTVLCFYIFYLFIPKVLFKKLDDIIDKLTYLITLFSTVGIIIAVKGSLLCYFPTQPPRVASIFFDPNYFGTLAAIGFILSIHRKDKYKVKAILNLSGLFFSGSRAAMIGLLFVMVFFYFYKNKLGVNSIFLFLLLCLLVYCFIVFLNSRGFFRVHQGLNLREHLWQISFELIKKEPLWGYGYGTARNMLKSKGSSNVSSHNAYIDYIMMYGMPSFLLYSVILIKSVYLGIKNNIPQYIIKCILLLLIIANSISINLGGLGATSLLLTLFLGICNDIKIKEPK